MKDYTEHDDELRQIMSALFNTASSYKLDANMLQAKRHKRNLTGCFSFLVMDSYFFNIFKSFTLGLPPSLRPHPSPATKMNIHIRFKAFEGIFQ